MKIIKKGEKFLLPIENVDIDLVKVGSLQGFFKPEEKQEIPFNGNLINIKLENGTKIDLTPDHIQYISLEKNSNTEEIELVEIVAKDLKIGDVILVSADSFKDFDDANYVKSKIVEINEVPYDGFVYDFTMPDKNFIANNLITHNCCVHPETLIDVELEEDLVLYKDEYYTMREAKKLKILT